MGEVEPEVGAQDNPRKPGSHKGSSKALLLTSRARNGLPVWLSVIVVLVLLGLLIWNILVVGPTGLSTTYILGGLLGAYAGIDRLLKRDD